jgi:hypothetical protein
VIFARGVCRLHSNEKVGQAVAVDVLSIGDGTTGFISKRLVAFARQICSLGPVDGEAAVTQMP